MYRKIENRFKGERNDTFHVNAFVMKCVSISLLVYLGCWILDVVGIFIVDLSIMTTGVLGSLAVCVLTYLYAFTAGIDKPVSRYVIMSSLVAIATVICTAMAYHTTMYMLFPLVCSMQYFDKRVSTYTFAMSCMGYAVAVMLGYRIGLCDANMLLLTYTNSAFHVAELVNGTFTVNTNESLMFLYFVFPRWLIMLAVMPLLNHVAQDIQSRSEREAKARHLAETDGLTGLYNRTKYLQSLVSVYVHCDNVAALFFDINNLKPVNDSLGHEYGDMLLCALADELQRRETENCKSYRLGGDEFVMILCKEEATRAEAIYWELNEKLQGRVIQDKVCLSVAIGMAEGKGRDIERLVQMADERMYRIKETMKAEEQ